MREWLKKYVDPWLPLYAVLPLTVSVTNNTVIYYVTQWMTKNRFHWNMETAFDRSLPVLPGFVSVYFSFFVFCAVNELIIAHLGRKKLYQFVFADVISRIICGICFLVIPTTNRRPVCPGGDFWWDALNLLYRIDQPVNLFPSIHCLASWMCFAAIRREKKLPVWYRSMTGILAILICVSTLVTRQHVIADVAAAVLLAEGLYAFSVRTEGAEKMGERMERWSQKIFGQKVRTKEKCKYEK